MLVSLKQARLIELRKFLLGNAALIRAVRKEPAGQAALVVIMGYNLKVTKSVTTGSWMDQLAPAFGEDFEGVKEAVMTAGDLLEERGRKRGRQEGRQEGRQQGRHEGLQEARHEMIQRLLVARFGRAPASLVDRIVTAGEGELDGWLARLLSASSLDELTEAS